MENRQVYTHITQSQRSGRKSETKIHFFMFKNNAIDQSDL